MRAAPRIEVSAPPEARARYLARTYADLAADRDRLEPLLGHLVALRGRAVVEHWLMLLRGGEYEAPLFALNFGRTRYERCPHCRRWHWTEKLTAPDASPK